MIDSLFNLVFRCSHGSLSHPITPLNAAGSKPVGEPYVVCLDCGKRFDWDADRFKIRPAAPSLRRSA